jgi:hypothetical protein
MLFQFQEFVHTTEDADQAVVVVVIVDVSATPPSGMRFHKPSAIVVRLLQ